MVQSPTSLSEHEYPPPPADWAEQLDSFRRSHEACAMQREELDALYPEEYVAFYDGELVGHSPDMAEVLTMLDERGMRENAYIGFATPRRYILLF
jgi:hypothetical protein